MNVSILDEALKITPKERVLLAELLLESIDYEDETLKKTWLNEVKARMQAVENGQAKLLDFNQRYVED